jgi:hypothetical protein
MGTNYYLRAASKCEHCGHCGEDLHIGKSSYGWCFALHVIPEKGLNSLADWAGMFEKFPDSIYDEYGDRFSPQQLLGLITNRSNRNAHSWNSEFLEKNHAVAGPDGLLRAKIGHNCIGHGEGTWDYIQGDFS